MRDLRGGQPPKPPHNRGAAASVGAAIGRQAPKAKQVARQRDQAISHHISHYAENPQQHAKALRQLGYSAAQVRVVHRNQVTSVRGIKAGGVFPHIDVGRVAHNALRQVERAPAELGPALLTTGEAAGSDLFHALVRNPTKLPKHSALYSKVVKPLAKSAAYMVGNDPIVVRVDKQGRPVYRAKGGGETQDLNLADRSVVAKVEERPLDYLLLGRGAGLGVGSVTARAAARGLLGESRRGLALPGRAHLEARTGERFSTPTSANPVRRAEQRATRKLTTGATRAVEKATGRELPIVGEHARAVRLGAKQQRRVQAAEVQRTLAPFHRAFRPLKPGEKIAVVLHAKGVKPSELARFVRERRAEATKAGNTAEARAHSQMLRFIAKTSDETYNRVSSDPKLTFAREQAERLSTTSGDILETVGKLSPDFRALRPYLTARVVGGARFVEPTAAKAGKPGEGLVRAGRRVESLQRRFDTALANAKEGEARPRPRTKAQAEAFVANVDAAYEKIIATMADAEVKPAAVVGRRNLQNVKLARRGRPLKPTLTAEARRHAENKVAELLRTSTHPTAVRLRSDLDEADRLRDVLSAARGDALMGEAPKLGRQDYGKQQRLPASHRPTVERLGGALSIAKDELRQREAAAARRVEPTGFVGGPALDDLKARLPGVFYHPDVGGKLRERGGAPQSQSGLVEPKVPTVAKRNRAVRLMTSRWLPSPQAWQDSYLKAVGYAHALARGELAYRVARPLRADGTAERGWYYVNLDGVKLAKVKDDAALSHSMDDFVQGDGDVERFISDELASKNGEVAARWEQEGKRVAQISPSDHRNIFGEFKGSSAFVRHVIDRPTDFWRALTLSYRPAWVVNNFVGQTLLYALNHSGPGGAVAYAHAVMDEGKKSGRYFPEDLRQGLFASEASQAGGIPGPRLVAGSLAGARNAERRMREKIATVNAALSDNVPRRAAWYAVADKHRKLLNRVESTNNTLDTFLAELEHAAEHGGSPHLRQLHDDLTQQVLDELIDFNDLSTFERRVIRRAVPFYSWLKGITKATVRLGLNRPLMAELLLQMSQAVGEKELRKWLGAGEETLQNFLPFSEKTTAAGRVATGLSTTGLNPFQTVSDVARMAHGGLSGHPASPFDNPANALAPQLQAGIEAISRRDLFSGKSLAAPGGIPGIFAEQMLRAFPQEQTGEALLHPRPAVGGNNKPVLSPGGGKTFGVRNEALRYLGVPVSTKNVDRAAQIAEENRRAQLSPVARTAAGYGDFRAEVAATVAKLTGHKEIPEPVAARLNLRQERASARAHVGAKTSLEGFQSDLGVAVAHGWMDDAKARQVLRWAHTATSDELRNAVRYMTRKYFDRDALLADSVRYLNRRAALDADSKAVAASGQKIDRAHLAVWAKRATVDELKSALAYLHSHYKPPAGGWTSTTLGLPDY